MSHPELLIGAVTEGKASHKRIASGLGRMQR